MEKQPNYSCDVVERAVRMVSALGEYGSSCSAIGSIAAMIGCTLETLRHWVR